MRAVSVGEEDQGADYAGGQGLEFNRMEAGKMEFDCLSIPQKYCIR